MFHRIQLDASDSDRNHWQCELMHRENYFPYLYIFGTGTYRGLQRGRGSELRSANQGFPWDGATAASVKPSAKKVRKCFRTRAKTPADPCHVRGSLSEPQSLTVHRAAVGGQPDGCSCGSDTPQFGVPSLLKSPGGPVVSRESHLKTVIILSSRAAKQPENYLR